MIAYCYNMPTRWQQTYYVNSIQVLLDRPTADELLEAHDAINDRISKDIDIIPLQHYGNNIKYRCGPRVLLIRNRNLGEKTGVVITTPGKQKEDLSRNT